MMKYYEYIQQLEKALGQNAKLDILEIALQDATFRMYTKQILNPYFNPYVRKVDSNIEGDRNQSNIIFPSLLNFLENVASRTNEAVTEVEAIISVAHPDEIPYLYRFLNRDMRCGVNRGLVKRIVPDLIPEFPIGLAAPWDEKRLKFPAYIEPKLDGIRCLAFVDGEKGTVTFLSRNGKQLDLDIAFHNDLKDLVGDKDKFVFDGELMGTDFQQLMTQAKRKREKDQSKLKYYIFDGMFMKDWHSQQTECYFDRKRRLMHMLCVHDTYRIIEENHMFSKIALVLGQMASNEMDLNAIFESYLEQGYEGCVIKQDTEYVFKRSSSWMKLKPTETWDGQIVGYMPGEPGKQFEHTLGALLVSIDGVTTQVGSGYSIEYRDELWSKREEIMGKMVEVAGDCLTNDGRVRFPRFVQFRPDKD